MARSTNFPTTVSKYSTQNWKTKNVKRWMGETERHIIVSCEPGFILNSIKAVRQYGHVLWGQSDGQEPIKADSHIACRAHAMPCRYGFRMCPPHSIYTVRPCLSHTCHAAPIPCSDQAALLKATAQHGRRETACGLPAGVRVLPATARSSTKFIRSIPISDAGGQSKQPHHSLITITQSRTPSITSLSYAAALLASVICC
jgi:hypothetical protein